MEKQKEYNRNRAKTELKCPKCEKIRLVRIDAFKKRKSDMCIKCSPLSNPQLLKSSHGLNIKHPLYKRWCGMIRRCKDPKKATSYLNKGITVCDEWKNYDKFYYWSLSNGFRIDLELDRIDNDKGYSPNNCQWITHKENIDKIENLFGRKKKL